MLFLKYPIDFTANTGEKNLIAQLNTWGTYVHRPLLARPQRHCWYCAWPHLTLGICTSVLWWIQQTVIHAPGYEQHLCIWDEIIFFLILFIFLLSNFDTFYRLDNVCFRRPVLLWPACFRSVLLRPACFIRPVLLWPACFIRPVLLGPACFIRPVLLGPVCFRRIILLRPAHFRRLVLLWPACFRRPVLLWLTYLERASSFKPQVNLCLT